MTSPAGSTRSVAADIVRGGTSKGVFLALDDLSEDRPERDRMILAMMGTPDPMQIDGLGGSHSSTSKVMGVRSSDSSDADVDYRFFQVGTDEPIVDDTGNCGNLSFAVGPWALERGFVDRADGASTMRMRNLNTGRMLRSRFDVVNGLPAHTDTAVPSGVEVELDHLTPAGAVTGKLLPTGSAMDSFPWRTRTIEMSVVDVASPVCLLRAEDLGLDGSESRAELTNDEQLLEDLERLRSEVAGVLGLGAPDGNGVSRTVPRIAILGPATRSADLGAISLSLQRVHHTIPATSALCVAAATRVPGTIAYELFGAIAANPSHATTVRISHFRGVTEVHVDASDGQGPIHIDSVGITGSTRTLMTGHARIDTRGEPIR